MGGMYFGLSGLALGFGMLDQGRRASRLPLAIIYRAFGATNKAARAARQIAMPFARPANRNAIRAASKSQCHSRHPANRNAIHCAARQIALSFTLRPDKSEYHSLRGQANPNAIPAPQANGNPLTTPPGKSRYRHRGALLRCSIHQYSQMMMPATASMPSHGPRKKSSGTRPIGASFDVPTMRPALSTPHKLSPTISPDATSVPRRSARSGFAEA